MAVSIYNIATGQGSLDDVINLIPGGALAKVGGKVFSVIRKAAGSMIRAAAHYVAQFGQRVWNYLKNSPMFQAGSGITKELLERIAKRGAACALCMAGHTQVWTPDGMVRLDDVNLGQLVTTEGDRVPDSSTGDLGIYGEAQAIQLWQTLAKQPYRPVHLHIERPDGSSTDVLQLIGVDELSQLGYKELVGTDARIWLPGAGKPHQQNDLASGWASVLAIGPEVTLGDGIEAPTPTAAPVMAVFITNKSDLYAYQLDGNAELQMTKTHPVWCETRNAWVLAGELKVGDRIRTAGGAGQACITNIRLAQAGATVYNLSVAGGHTFFVGDDKAWVHNAGIRNKLLAGLCHPKTGIPFDANGFPDFSKVQRGPDVVLPGGHRGRKADFDEANRAAGYRETPSGYTWHHHQDGRTMQLVPADIHAKTGHTGSRPGP